MHCSPSYTVYKVLSSIFSIYFSYFRSRHPCPYKWLVHYRLPSQFLLLFDQTISLNNRSYSGHRTLWDDYAPCTLYFFLNLYNSAWFHVSIFVWMFFFHLLFSCLFMHSQVNLHKCTVCAQGMRFNICKWEIKYKKTKIKTRFHDDLVQSFFFRLKKKLDFVCYIHIINVTTTLNFYLLYIESTRKKIGLMSIVSSFCHHW